MKRPYEQQPVVNCTLESKQVQVPTQFGDREELLTLLTASIAREHHTSYVERNYGAFIHTGTSRTVLGSFTVSFFKFFKSASCTVPWYSSTSKTRLPYTAPNSRRTYVDFSGLFVFRAHSSVPYLDLFKFIQQLWFLVLFSNKYRPFLGPLVSN